MPATLLTVPGSMTGARAQSPITLYVASAAGAGLLLHSATGGESGAGRPHPVPNTVTETSMTAAISEKVLRECMEHLREWRSAPERVERERRRGRSGQT